MASHLYILQCEHFFKIGCTNTSVKNRVSSMKTGNPFHINIALDVMFSGEYDGYSVEQLLHEKYKKKRGLGEWFMLNYSDIEDIKEYTKAYKGFKKMTIGHFSEIPALDPRKRGYWREKYMSDIQKLSRIEKDHYWRSFNWSKWEDDMRQAFREREVKLSKKEDGKIKRKKELAAKIEEMEKEIQNLQFRTNELERCISGREEYLAKLDQHPSIITMVEQTRIIKNALNEISKIEG